MINRLMSLVFGLLVLLMAINAVAAPWEPVYKDFGVINGCRYEAYWSFEDNLSSVGSAQHSWKYDHTFSNTYYHNREFDHPWMYFAFMGVVYAYSDNDPYYPSETIPKSCIFNDPPEVVAWMEQKKNLLDLWASLEYVKKGGELSSLGTFNRLPSAPNPTHPIRLPRTHEITAKSTTEYTTAVNALTMGQSYPIVIEGAKSGTLCGTIAFLEDSAQKRLDFIFKLWDVNVETGQCFGQNQRYEYRIKNSCLEFTNLWGFTRNEITPNGPDLTQEEARDGFRSIALGDNGLYGMVFKRCENNKVSDELIQFHANLTELSIQEDVKFPSVEGRSNRTLRLRFSHGLDYHVILN